jgi:hypothetical protein
LEEKFPNLPAPPLANFSTPVLVGARGDTIPKIEQIEVVGGYRVSPSPDREKEREEK